jgi:hypothetical protein
MHVRNFYLFFPSINNKTQQKRPSDASPTGFGNGVLKNENMGNIFALRGWMACLYVTEAMNSVPEKKFLTMS